MSFYVTFALCTCTISWPDARPVKVNLCLDFVPFHHVIIITQPFLFNVGKQLFDITFCIVKHFDRFIVKRCTSTCYVYVMYE